MIVAIHEGKMLGQQPEENISRAITVLSPRFLYY